MSLLFYEGFENMGSTADASSVVRPRIELRYPGGTLTNGNGIDLVDNDLADGGKALRWGTTTASEFNFIRKHVPDQAGKTLIVGGRIRLNSNATSDSALFIARGLLADQLHIEIQNNANVRLMRGFTELAIQSAVVTAAAWQYVEWEFSVHNSTGHTKVWVDGTLVMDVSALDTQNGSTDTIDQIELGGLESVSGADFAGIDDVYCLNTDGAELNARLEGETRVLGRLATSDGSVTDFTPSTPGDHYILVDEDPETTTDYVEDTTGEEIFGFAAAPTGTDINAIQVEAIVRAEGSGGIAKLRAKVRSGATSATGDTDAVASTDEDIVYRHIFTQDPNTAAAWGAVGADNADFGLEIV